MPVGPGWVLGRPSVEATFSIKGGADLLSWRDTEKNQETKIVRPVGIPKKKVVGLKRTKICTKKKRNQDVTIFFSWACGPT